MKASGRGGGQVPVEGDSFGDGVQGFLAVAQVGEHVRLVVQRGGEDGGEGIGAGVARSSSQGGSCLANRRLDPGNLRFWWDHRTYDR